MKAPCHAFYVTSIEHMNVYKIDIKKNCVSRGKESIENPDQFLRLSTVRKNDTRTTTKKKLLQQFQVLEY